MAVNRRSKMNYKHFQKIEDPGKRINSLISSKKYKLKYRDAVIDELKRLKKELKSVSKDIADIETQIDEIAEE